MVYEKDHLNTVPKEVIAEHMGYKTLNGASLGVISAVSKFGLLVGGSDGMRVTDRALAILVHDKGEPPRASAIEEAAHAPSLFEELFVEFPNGASDNAIKSFLQHRKKFLPTAVPVAIRAFKDTLAVVQEESAAYDAGAGDDDGDDSEEAIVLQTPPATQTQPAPMMAMPASGFEIGFTGQAIRLVGNIGSQAEADKVLKAIEALKLMLPPDTPSTIN
jgi:hypothetical protein